MKAEPATSNNIPDPFWARRYSPHAYIAVKFILSMNSIPNFRCEGVETPAFWLRDS